VLYVQRQSPLQCSCTLFYVFHHLYLYRTNTWQCLSAPEYTGKPQKQKFPIQFLGAGLKFNYAAVKFNYKQTNFIKCPIKNTSCICLKINLGSRSKKCLGLQIDKLNCIIDTDYIFSKLNSACIAVSTVMPVMKKDTLKSYHFAYIHFITYGFIFWGNLADSNKV
jgi:hypothetical protein